MQTIACTVEPCPDCGADAWQIDERRNEAVCTACGLVQDAHVVRELPPKPIRASPGHLGRLAKIDRQTRHVTSSQQRLRDATAEMRRVAETVGCPIDIAGRAEHILRRARKAHLTQGRSLDALAAAALLAACRLLFLTRTPKDFAEASKADPDEIQQAYKALVSGLRLPVPAMSAFEYISQLASKVGLDPALVAPAQAKLSCVCGTPLAAGKNPIGWAAAGLVLAARDAGQPISVNAIAKVAGVSGTTIAARIADVEAAACDA